MADSISEGAPARPASSFVDFSVIKQNTPPGFESWAECKKQAWHQLDVNPNGFFYRHLLPGEKKKNGPWTETEKQLFIKAIREHPPSSGHWGLFSRHIPGRVGYQCNAFYKKLVASGEISLDSNPKVTEKQENNAITERDLPKITVIRENNSNIPNINNEKDASNIFLNTAKMVSKSSLLDDRLFSFANVRPPRPIDPSRRINIFTGDDYAFKYSIIDSSDDVTGEGQWHNEEDVDTFRDNLVESLKDASALDRFTKFAGFYFKICE
ncbi:hypothetical protein TRFO_43238 [Tritrichomonas foetus]|uniref:Uncharacterized protein n=1 Tax=Tritrichomonas foetus TaxID=1144522 RepID=A0A1J4KSH9_9EUKA|nr:hypothetical protein TRFO_43238 [Tritrichomonas foetus]|eukprot:OHT13840.1 hypothetical protein TRFO_43238 [Tritrichomonas foetus]